MNLDTIYFCKICWQYSKCIGTIRKQVTTTTSPTTLSYIFDIIACDAGPNAAQILQKKEGCIVLKESLQELSTEDLLQLW